MRINDVSCLMSPVVIGLYVHLAIDVPILERSNGQTNLLRQLIIIYLIATTILQNTNIVDITHQITIWIIHGTNRTSTTHDIIIKIIIQISMTAIVLTSPTSTIAQLHILTDLRINFSSQIVTLGVITTITNQTTLLQVVSGSIVSKFLVTTTHTSVMLLRERATFKVLVKPINISVGMVIVPLATTAFLNKDIADTILIIQNFLSLFI